MRAYLTKGLPVIVLMGFLAACSNGTDIMAPPPPVADTPPPPPPPPAVLNFQATISNLTNAQPMSPAAVIVHNLDFSVFKLGSPASVALEVLAEGGDNSDLLAAAGDNVNVVVTAGGQGPIPPGQSEMISFEFEETNLESAYLSISTMLVNTNDAFTGVSDINLQNMAVGDVMMMRGVAYDAGTEADTERAIYIPGPAGGGEGFNGERDDNVSAVTMHTGVVGADDGLVTSGLNNQHKFDNPTFQVRIERIE